jgi:hypothetical protein
MLFVGTLSGWKYTWVLMPALPKPRCTAHAASPVPVVHSTETPFDSQKSRRIGAADLRYQFCVLKRCLRTSTTSFLKRTSRLSSSSLYNTRTRSTAIPLSSSKRKLLCRAFMRHGTKFVSTAEILLVVCSMFVSTPNSFASNWSFFARSSSVCRSTFAASGISRANPITSTIQNPAPIISITRLCLSWKCFANTASRISPPSPTTPITTSTTPMRLLENNNASDSHDSSQPRPKNDTEANARMDAITPYILMWALIAFAILRTIGVIIRKKLEGAKTCAIFTSHWVRKLTGKPAFLTIADCESEARRIQFQAAASSVSRIHSDWVFPALATAPLNRLASSWASLTAIRTCLDLVFGTLGLPGFLGIKYLMFYNNSSCN